MLDQEARTWIDEALASPERERLLRVMRKLRRCEQADPSDKPRLEALLKLEGISTWMRRELIRLLYQLQDAGALKDSGFLLSLRGEDEAWSFELGELMTRREMKDPAMGRAGWRAWIELLLEALQDPAVDEGFARIAFQLLGHEGALEAAASSMREDIAGLAALWLERSEDGLLRHRASWLLLATGAGAKNNEEVLIRLLSDPEAQIAAQAAQTLGRLKKLSPEADMALEKALQHPYYAVRGYAVESLKLHPRPLSKKRLGLLHGMLVADEPWERRMTVEALGRLARGPEIDAALWCKALVDEDDHISIAAMDALRAWEVDLVAYLPALIEQLSHVMWRRRQNAARVLERAGDVARAAVPALASAFHDPRWRVRRAFLMALTQIAPDESAACQVFLEALEDEEWQTRMCAADALGRAQTQPQVRVEGLCRALQDPVWEVRHAAAISLSTLHRHLDGYIEPIAACLSDERVQVARVAAKVLSKVAVEHPSARQHLEDAAQQGSEGIRGVCAGLLRALERARGEETPQE